MPKSNNKLDWRDLSTGNETAMALPFTSVTEARKNLRLLVPKQVNKAGRLTEGLSFPYGSNKREFHVLETRKIIHGDDDRVQVQSTQFPYRSICRLLISKDGSTEFGTGFFISERCVITAGHCVFSSGNWADEITVIPGTDGSATPFGTAVSRRFKSAAGWAVDGDINFDYGAVLLEDEVLFNAIGGRMQNELDLAATELEVAGYPNDKLGAWKCNGRLHSRTKFRLGYELDTVAGQSGAPIMESSHSGHKIIGVHTQGDNPNWGLRLRAEMRARWTQWSAL